MQRDITFSPNLFRALTALIFLTAIIRFSFSSLNHDVSWMLYCAQQMQAGKTLYVDMLEVNPPLIIWLAHPAVWISDITGVSAGGGYKIWMFVLTVLSLLISAPLLKRLRIGNTVWMIPALTFLLTWMSGHNFAQREHFMAVLILPYVILTALRREGARINPAAAAGIAAIAAIGICIKPYFILVPAALEVYLLFAIGLKATLKRPEPYAMVILGLGYLAAIFKFTPEYIDAAFGYISDVYSAGFKTGVGDVLYEMLPVIAALLVGGVAAVKAKADMKAAPPLYVAFGLTALALAAGYFIQFKGWLNHAYPVYVFAAVPALVAAICLWRNGKDLKVYAILMASAVMFMTVAPLLGAKWRDTNNHQIGAYLKAEHNAQSLFILSANLYDGFPMVTEHDFKWGSRFNAMWPVPGLQSSRDAMRAEKRARLGAAENFTRAALAQDLNRSKPDVILVDIREAKNMFTAPYDYIEDFSETPDFAREFSHYERVDWPGEYALYIRKPEN